MQAFVNSAGFYGLGSNIETQLFYGSSSPKSLFKAAILCRSRKFKSAWIFQTLFRINFRKPAICASTAFKPTTYIMSTHNLSVVMNYQFALGGRMVLLCLRHHHKLLANGSEISRLIRYNTLTANDNPLLISRLYLP